MVQKRLHTIHVGAAEVLEPLTAYLRGEGGATTGATLRRLILEDKRYEVDLDTAVEELGALLAEGRCPALEELNSISLYGADASHPHLYKGLQGCAELRYLNVPFGREYLMAVMEALERAAWPKLRVLEFPIHFGDQASDAVVKAFRACPRPALRTLCVRLLPGATGLGDALRSGACRGLRSLGLQGSLSADLEALGGALGEGACPDLRELQVITNGVGPQLARALSEAVRAGGLASLEELRVMGDASLTRGRWRWPRR
jgi:hypothetical protein